jgi:hypothetical protein
LERKKRESKDSNYSAAELDAIRDSIYQMYKDKDRPTVQSLLVKLREKCLPFDISIASLTRLLHKIGFTYKLLNRRTSTMEIQRLIRWRTDFISIIRKYRAEGRKITYLDETWFDTHDVVSRGWVDNSGRCFLETPPSRGKRLIVLNAGNEDGWIPNCLLISAKNIASAKVDYHCDMDAALFEKWFSEQLIPNLTTRQLEALVAFLENNKENLAENRKLTK